MILLDSHIRKVPDFPKKGIVFYDITSIWANPEILSYCVEQIANNYKKKDLCGVAAIEARGFVFGSLVAQKLKLPFIPIRKKGKLPGETVSASYDLEYGSATIEVHKEDIPQGKVLILDDLIATGGTLRAAIDLFCSNGAVVEDVAAVIGLPYLNYMEKFKDVNILTLIEYFDE